MDAKDTTPTCTIFLQNLSSFFTIHVYQATETLYLIGELKKLKKRLLQEYCVLTLHALITEFREIPLGV
jgi:hypothetical protein